MIAEPPFEAGAAQLRVTVELPPATELSVAEQSADALIDAMKRFESEAGAFDPRAARRNALQFRKDRYEAELFGYVETVVHGERPVSRTAA